MNTTSAPHTDCAYCGDPDGHRLATCAACLAKGCAPEPVQVAAREYRMARLMQHRGCGHTVLNNAVMDDCDAQLNQVIAWGVRHGRAGAIASWERARFIRADEAAAYLIK